MKNSVIEIAGSDEPPSLYVEVTLAATLSALMCKEVVAAAARKYGLHALDDQMLAEFEDMAVAAWRAKAQALLASQRE